MGPVEEERRASQSENRHCCRSSRRPDSGDAGAPAAGPGRVAGSGRLRRGRPPAARARSPAHRGLLGHIALSALISLAYATFFLTAGDGHLFPIGTAGGFVQFTVGGLVVGLLPGVEDTGDNASAFFRIRLPALRQAGRDDVPRRAHHVGEPREIVVPDPSGPLTSAPSSETGSSQAFANQRLSDRCRGLDVLAPVMPCINRTGNLSVGGAVLVRDRRPRGHRRPRMSAAYSVKPGPNAIATTCSPSSTARSSRSRCSTSRMVALEQLPTSRRTS